MQSQSPRITIPSPGPRGISFITLLLRAIVGLQLFRITVSSYLAGLAYGQSQRVNVFLLPPSAPILLIDIFQYSMIAMSVALMLGFFTRVAAASIGILFAASTLLQIVLEMRAGVPTGFSSNPIQALDAFNFMQLRQYIMLQLVLILWFAGASTNIYSLDGLMFLKRRSGEKPRSKDTPTGPRLTGGRQPSGSTQETGTSPPKEMKAWEIRELDYYKADTGSPSRPPDAAS